MWQGGVCGGGGVHGREGACVAGETATAADGTHPTGMHSCFCRPQRSWGKVTFSQASVLLTGGGGAIPACIAGGIPACLACLGGGVWPSVVVFCYALLVWWPSD